MALVPAPRARREYWSLLLIPVTLLLLDSYGWFAPGTIPQTPQRQQTVLPPHRMHQLMPDLPESIKTLPPQALKAHLESMQGDLHPVSIVSKDAAPREYTLPPLPPGHYRLHTTHQGQSIAQQAIQIAPLPRMALDRHYTEAGESLSLWRAQPTAAQQYRLVHRHKGPQAEDRLSAQNPSRLDLPSTLPAGEYRLVVEGAGSSTFQVLAPSQDLQVQVHDNLLLPGVKQSVDLHILDTAQQPLKQGWVRMANQSYAIRNGKVKIPLEAGQIASSIPFTAGVAEGQVVQGTLSFVLASTPWMVRSLPVEQPKDSLFLWQGQSKAPLTWSAQQGPLSLQGQITADQTGLQHLQRQLQSVFSAARPVHLKLSDAQGAHQHLTFQWPQVSTILPELSPKQPHALSSLRIQASALHPYVSQHHRSDHWQIAALLTESPLLTAQAKPFTLAFVWFLLGLLLSGIPLSRATTRRRPLLPSEPILRATRQARWGIYGGSSLWLLSLPALWLGMTQGAWQSYLMGLAVNAFALTWALRHRRLPTHPVWIFTQTALLLLCAWFSLTYAPFLLGALVLWSGVLHFAWIVRFKDWQRQSKAPSPAQIAMISLLAIFSLLHAGIALQHSHTPAPSPEQQSLRHIALPVPHLQLQHSAGVPTTFELQGKGGTQLISSLNRQAQWDTQTLEVRHTPYVEVSAPPLAHQRDLLTLNVVAHNPTLEKVSVPLRLRTPLGLQQEQVILAPGEQKPVPFHLRYAQSGLQNYALEQYYDQQWHRQQWQTYVTPFEAGNVSEAVKFSPLRIQVSYPQETLSVGEEIPVIVDVQHRLPEDTALSITLGIPTGFTPLIDTLQESKHKSWLADLRVSSSAMHLETQVLRAGQRVRFHSRLKANFAGQFQTPAAVLKNLSLPALEEKARSTTLSIQAQTPQAVLE